MTSPSSAARAAGIGGPAACSLCGSISVAVLEARDVNRAVSSEIFRYVRCAACGSLSLGNVPADLGRYYPTSYYDVPTTLVELDRRTAGERYKLDLIARWVSSGRLIEMGPAYGLFARAAQLAGYEVETIEMDERCCAFLRDVVGVGATRSDDVVRALGSLDPADVIAMWHVLEHLPDPWATLAGAAAHLRPGGILVLATPNPAALQFRLFGRYWTHLDAPRHLHLLSSAAVERRGRMLGLEPVLISTTDAGSLGWNSFGWAVTLRNFFRAPLLRAIAHFGGRIVSKLAAPIERRGRLGSAYTIVFRRPDV